MKNLVATLGITGCGKTYWLKDKSPVVETDDLRLELLDDIDDYTQDGLIFSTAAKRISDLFDSYNTVYFGATLVNSKKRIPFLQSIKDICKHSFVIDIIVFPSDPKVSKERIEKDLESEILRANSIYLIDKQYEQYLYTVDQLYIEQPFYRNIKIN